jgi:CcmD family protein
MNFLYAAYTATWIIHIVYLSTLVRRYQRLSKEIAELKKQHLATPVKCQVQPVWVGHSCPTP